MSLSGVKIGFALTGSFCTFNKIIPEISKLADEKASVYPIISRVVYSLDTRFGKAIEIRKKLVEITGNEVITSIVEAEPIGPKSLLDIVVVCPCTGNTISKISNAITDTTVTMAVKSHLRNNKPVIIGVSTNDGLGANAKNIAVLLNMKNIYFVPFGQDAPFKKPNSLLAKNDMILPSIEAALEGKQIQPLFVAVKE
jgi:dipicolinate synthase subunit B